MQANNVHDQHSHSSFEDFMLLPNEVKAQVMSFCDFKTKLNLSETCPLLNDLLFSTPKLIKKIQLKIDCFKDDEDESVYTLNLMEKLFTISSNGRQYINLRLFRLDDALYSVASSLLYRVLRDVGASVKKLHILCGTYRICDLAKVFKFFTNVTKVEMQNGKLSAVENLDVEDVQSFLPNLTELVFKYSTTTMPKAFRGIKSLKTLKFQTYNDDWTDSLEEFESFLTNQKDLTTLVVHGTGASAEYRKIMKAIMELQGLESLEVLRVIDFPDLFALGNLSNSAMKKLKYRGNENSNTQMLQSFIRIFPNLQSINFSFMTTFTIDNEIVDKLAILKEVKSPKGITYQPKKFHIDQEVSEKDLQQFICQAGMVMNLTIGDVSWIEKKMGFSSQMWIPILSSCYLHKVKIFNPLEVFEIVMMFAACKTLYSVEIYTTAEGMQSIDEVKIPSWMKVYVV